MQDESIVELYWKRDESAIRQTEEKYGHYLTKIAFNILSDYDDTLESVNDTYWKVWNSMPPHKPNMLSTYLGKITRELSIDMFRKKKGTIISSENLEIDFNGKKSYKTLIQLEVEKVIRGDCKPGETISILTESTYTSSSTGYLLPGTTGIFLPIKYDSDSYMEMNGTVIYWNTIADYCLYARSCAFLETESGIIYDHTTYSALENAQTLEDVETYILQALKK